MYNLADFSLQDMSACSAALRSLGRHAAGLEDAAGLLVRHLYDHLNDGRTGKPACALVRLFQTQPYGELSPESQAVVQTILGKEPVSRELKCLTLVGTAGEQPEWNRTDRSHRYKAIPLVSAKFVAQFPMFSQLFTQLGVNVDTTLPPQSALFVDAEEHTFNVFHVSDALGSPFVPVQQEFVIPYGIRSVLGFGGLLPSGRLFVVVLFSKVFVSRPTADLFKPLALSAKLALLPFDGSPAVRPPVDTRGNSRPRSTHLESQIAALEQLLAVHEEAVIINVAQRKRAEEALHESETRLSAVVHSTNDVVVFIDTAASSRGIVPPRLCSAIPSRTPMENRASCSSSMGLNRPSNALCKVPARAPRVRSRPQPARRSGGNKMAGRFQWS